MTQKDCSIEGCGPAPRLVKGYCNRHYQMNLRHGDPLHPKFVKNITCAIEGCGKETKTRGWCSAHYTRWQRHGSPLGGASTRYKTPEESFGANTRWEGSCLVWTGYRNSLGYGHMRVNGVQQPTHRYAYEAEYGRVDKGLVIDHMCHNPPCVNPIHLQAVTHKQNMENQKRTSSKSSSGFRGVVWDTRSQRWIVQVHHNRKKYLGGRFVFDDLDLAVKAVSDLRNLLHTNNLDDREQPSDIA